MYFISLLCSKGQLTSFQSFAECKRIMLRRGKLFYEQLIAARGKIAKLANNFFTDGCVRIS